MDPVDKKLIAQVSQKINNALRTKDYAALEAVFIDHPKLPAELIDAQGNTLLHLGCLMQDKAVVRLIAKHYPELVNVKNSKGRLPIHLAAIGQSPVIIAMLLNTPHKHLETLDYRGLTFVHYALFSQKRKIRERMLQFIERIIVKSTQKNVDEGIELLPMGHFPIHFVKPATLKKILHSRDLFDQNFLHYMASLNDLAQFQFFERVLPEKLWKKNTKNMTVLHFAAKNNATHILRYLLKANHRELDAVDIDYATPLHYAVSNGHTEAAKLLLQAGANDYLRTSFDVDVTHLAACRKDSVMLNCLAKNNSRLPIGNKNIQGQTPLMIAASNADASFIAKLFEIERTQTGGKDYPEGRMYPVITHLNVNAKDRYGLTALHWAVLQNNQNTVALLLTHPKLSGTLEDVNKKTALAYAIMNQKLPIVKLLWESPKIVQNQLLEHRCTYFYMACRYGNVEIVRYLLESSATARAMLMQLNINGQSPLHAAVLNGDEKLVKLLLEKGAFQNPDQEGKLPAQLAIEHGWGGIANLIQLHEASTVALKRGYTNNIRHLFKQIAVDSDAESGNNMLHKACIKGDFSEIKKYLLLGGDPLTKNHQQKNAFDLLLDHPADDVRIAALVDLSYVVDEIKILSEAIYPYRKKGYEQVYEFVMGECAFRAEKYDLAEKFYKNVDSKSGWMAAETVKKQTAIQFYRQKQSFSSLLGRGS